ncbi:MULTISPECIES: TIGR01548 family HAD-type hydrolase [Prochlorococcus]|uniref:TIGR01548 family HAD-type hydrolase n=1 Tax=Prochlorococcus TaxID=1218 RepID=UPI0005337D94|nr:MULTISPECIES: TIGR01548 family HAD-type hydrolase [Prochlorococcus]KGG13468.1 hypothetical protein EV05_0122 [Prochlorococcus sp. MIT 0601]
MDLKGLILFDIDGVIRDVSSSYHLALKKTVNSFCGWEPSHKDIDSLKSEGCWNNDWDASLELIKRYVQKKKLSTKLPERQSIIKIFSDFYFGKNQGDDPFLWEGFIKDEPLLVEPSLFKGLTKNNIGWGFFSGAEPPSAKYVLESRLGLKNAPLRAMGDVPDKPDPTGLIELSQEIYGMNLGSNAPVIGYLGDTVADVLTVKRARKEIPTQSFLSIAIAPPHLHQPENLSFRLQYESQLKQAGADIILKSSQEILKCLLKQWQE